MVFIVVIKDVIIFENGKVVQLNFYNNCMLWIDEMFEIEVYIFVDGGLVIKGVGEFGLFFLVLVLCNVVFVLIGKCVRKLFFDLNNV